MKAGIPVVKEAHDPAGTSPAGVRRRRVLVTGASRGLGLAIAVECGRRGTDVALTYNSDRSAAEDAVEQVRALGVDATMHQYALGDAESAICLREDLEALGGIDSAILNAGVWNGGPIGTLSDDEWWRVVELNVRSSQQLCVELLPQLKLGDRASITVVSSVVGLIGFAGDTAYAAAKAALVGFARSLAKELAPLSIRVNTLAPGFVSTAMTAAVSNRSRDRIVGGILLGRAGTTTEIGTAAAFLALDATYMTGAVLVVDGGWSI